MTTENPTDYLARRYTDAGAVDSYEAIEADVRLLMSHLTDEKMRHIKFDGWQAAQFYGLDHDLAEKVGEPLRLPFDWMHIRFSPPVELALEETYMGSAFVNAIEGVEELAGIDPGQVGSTHMRGAMILGGDEHALSDMPAGRNCAFVLLLNEFHSPLDERHSTDSHFPFLLDLDSGEVLLDSVMLIADDEEWHLGKDVEQIGEDVVVLKRGADPARPQSSFERQARLSGQFVGWLLRYMTQARGIQIVPEQMDRAARRRLKRKGLQNPWYVIRADLKYTSGGDGTDTGTRHGHRYDVRGHWRVMADGKAVWVKPHQGG